MLIPHFPLIFVRSSLMRCIYIAERLFGLNIKVYWNKIESIIKNTKSVITGYSFEYINKKSNILIQVWHHLCGTVTNMKLNVEYWIILSEIFYTFPSMLNMLFKEYPPKVKLLNLDSFYS